MTQAGGESATSGFREQMAWQLRAARVLTDLLERGTREGLPVLEWTISHTGAQVTGRCYAQPGSCPPGRARRVGRGARHQAGRGTSPGQQDDHDHRHG